MKLEVSAKKENNEATISLSGEVTASTAQDFDKAVSDNLSDTKLMIIDFKDCPFISSAGLRVLMKALQTLDQRGGKIRLINVREVIMDVLHSTYLDDVFEIECID